MIPRRLIWLLPLSLQMGTGVGPVYGLCAGGSLTRGVRKGMLRGAVGPGGPGTPLCAFGDFSTERGASSDSC